MDILERHQLNIILREDLIPLFILRMTQFKKKIKKPTENMKMEIKFHFKSFKDT